MKHETLISIICIFIFTIVFGSCVGNSKLQSGITESIRQGAESDGRLGATVEQLAEADRRIAETGRQLGDLSDDIRNTLRGIRDTEWETYGSIQQLQGILDDYNSPPERVLRQVDNIRNEVANKKQDIDSINNYIYNISTNENSGICTIH